MINAPLKAELPAGKLIQLHKKQHAKNNALILLDVCRCEAHSAAAVQTVYAKIYKEP